MRFDGWSLIYAVGVEAVLATAAVFGGPHGALGALPWLLNMPGILVIFGLGVERFFLARVAFAVAIQVGLWYFGFALIRRRRHSGARVA
ncbi:MAG: hypothetical protein U0974_10920 [Gemmatimonadales bacterium]|nr:hypothetical protein [Gemmatimonadales bacterium]MDZ4390224.1 hypothetical protein [Gemmatimonadales bacterium]